MVYDLVPQNSSPSYSRPTRKPKAGKRVGDSAFGQPRSDTVSPKRLKLDDAEDIAYMPSFTDVDETKVKTVESEICPILTQHFVYPFTNNVDPTLVVKILTENVSVLLDTGAHVSVLPNRLITETIRLPDQDHAKRHVKVFDGAEIVLDGPVLLDIIICDVHPFLYVDAEIPAIGGYDLLRAAHIIIDTHSAEVWSKHPDVVNHSSISENIFATVQLQSLSDGRAPITTPVSAPVSCVTFDTTTRIPEDTLPAVTETSHTALVPRLLRHGGHTFPCRCDYPPYRLNPFAPPFDPPRGEAAQTETEQNKDELPAHINLLYETTIAQTRLTADVDRQFRDVLRRRAPTFAKDSTDIVFCPVLQHDVDTGDSPPIKQSQDAPLFQQGMLKMKLWTKC